MVHGVRWVIIYRLCLAAFRFIPFVIAAWTYVGMFIDQHVPVCIQITLPYTGLMLM
jgi:hypothetical protein